MDRIAAMSTKTRLPVTIDIMGKKDTFILSPQGKPLTPPFRGFTAGDIARLKTSPAGQFTMQIPVADPRLVAASALKTAYLAMFSLFGRETGYHYIGGTALLPVRQLVRDPFRHASASVGSYVTATPNDAVPLDAQIMLVAEPHPCWIVRIRDHHVFLPLDCNGTERAPLTDRYIRDYGGHEARLSMVAYWPFQTFATPTAVPVHLPGADRMQSLLGRTIRGTPPSGTTSRGVCVRHNGESALLLCGEASSGPQ